ncbi:unnamed protein product, partial [Ectocarpus fasciculatus]
MRLAPLYLVPPSVTPTATVAWPCTNNHRHAYAPTTRPTTTAHRLRTTCAAAAAAVTAVAQEDGQGQDGPNNVVHTTEELLALGRRQTQAGDLEAAIYQFERAASQAPRSAVCQTELGRALVRLGRGQAGFNCLVAAFGIDSLCPGVKDGFREYYRAEIEADPSNIDLHEGLAALCVDSGNPEEAAALYRRCLGLHAAAAAAAAAAEGGRRIPSFSSPDPSKPDDPDSKEATGAAAAAVARTDRWSVALFKCDASLCQWDDWNDEALTLRAAVRRRGGLRRPGRTRGGGFGGRLPSAGDDGDLVERLLLGYEDDDDFDSQRQGNSDGGSYGVSGDASPGPSRPALHPFDSLSAPLSIGDCLAVAQQQTRGVLAEARGSDSVPQVGKEEEREETEGVGWVQGQRMRQFHTGLSSSSSSLRDERGRVRLGYVSGDLMGTHPLTHLMQSTFGMHDRKSFEVFLYALNPDDGSEQRRRMEGEVENFRDLSMMTAAEAAAAIEDDGVGVLVNLGGYAGTVKSADIFALRPAAVAVSYMGFPGTMGSREMADYILADAVVVPPDLRRFYSEKV